MMNRNFLLFLLITAVLFLVSCDKVDDPVVTNPFDNPLESGSTERRKIVVISDLHMGNGSTDHNIEMNLFDGLFTLEVWDASQQFNNVTVMNNIDKSIEGSPKSSFIDDQEEVQTFGTPSQMSDWWSSVIPTTR